MSESGPPTPPEGPTGPETPGGAGVPGGPTPPGGGSFGGFEAPVSPTAPGGPTGPEAPGGTGVPGGPPSPGTTDPTAAAGTTDPEILDQLRLQSAHAAQQTALAARQTVALEALAGPRRTRVRHEKPYTAPFRDSIDVQYSSPRADGRVRLGKVWDMGNAGPRPAVPGDPTAPEGSIQRRGLPAREGAELDWGDQRMQNQEYIVSMRSGQRWFITGPRVYDLSELEHTDGRVQRFRDFPTDRHLHRTGPQEEGLYVPTHTASNVPKGVDTVDIGGAGQILGKKSNPARIGGAWEPFPSTRTLPEEWKDIITKVEVRGELQDPADGMIAVPDGGPDPFDNIDRILPGSERTAQRMHPEHRSDHEPYGARATRLGARIMSRMPIRGAGPRTRPRELPPHYPHGRHPDAGLPDSILTPLADRTIEGERVSHAYGLEEWSNMSERERHATALMRTYKMIDAMSTAFSEADLRSEDKEVRERAERLAKLETTIEVYEPIWQGHKWLAAVARSRGRGVNPAQVSKGQRTNDPRNAVNSEKVERTTGWGLTFMLDSDQILPKRAKGSHDRTLDLFIEKRKPEQRSKYRSWMGGLEVLRVEGTDRPGIDRPTLLEDGHIPAEARTLPATPRYETPPIVAVGPAMGSRGTYGDQAIERWTRPNKPEGENIAIETGRLIKIANRLYELAEEEAGVRLDIPENLRPDRFVT